MGRADTYVQPQAADPVLTDTLVLDLARKHVPRARAVTGVDESGGEARAYLVDDDIVVKTQRPHRLRPRTGLAKEAYLLDVLELSLRGRIPRLFGYDTVETDQGTVEYLCMSRIPGQAVRHVSISAEARRDLLRELGVVLRTVHSASVDFGRMPFDADAAAVRRRLEFGFGDIVDAFAERGSEAVALPIALDGLVAKALGALPEGLALEPAVLHSNPSPTHVFVDPVTGRFAGLIDFGDSYASHAALDLHRWPDPADRVVLRCAYLDGVEANSEFDRMWTIAMIYTDLAVVVTGSPHAADAAADLAVRLEQL